MFNRSGSLLLDVVLFAPVLVFVALVSTHGVIKALDVNKTLNALLVLVGNR